MADVCFEKQKNEIIFVLNVVVRTFYLLPAFKIGAANKTRTCSPINIAIILYMKRVRATIIACHSAMYGSHYGYR